MINHRYQILVTENNQTSGTKCELIREKYGFEKRLLVDNVCFTSFL